MFIDHAPDYEKFPALRKGYRPEQWAYIPAKLSDNPYMRDDYAETDLAVLAAAAVNMPRMPVTHAVITGE